MSVPPPSLPDISTLNTKVEEDFVSPLTAIRGALEILRDYPEMEPERRGRFIDNAIGECARLERGVAELATAVYAAARRGAAPGEPAPPPRSKFAERIHLLEDQGIVEIDFSDFQFTDSHKVDAVFDAIEAAIRPTGRRWYVMTDMRNCSVWPEAWVAFAHRGKKVRVNYALGAVRYADSPDGALRARSGAYEPDFYGSRDEAVAAIARIKSAAEAKP